MSWSGLLDQSLMRVQNADDGNPIYVWDKGGDDADAMRYSPQKSTWERYDRDAADWQGINMRQTGRELANLGRWRNQGTPSMLNVRPDMDRCIFTNLIWHIHSSPEVAKVVHPSTRERFQISQTDLRKKPFMIEVNNDSNRKDDVIKIMFDQASAACDNQMSIEDEREITRDKATVLNILRCIRAMTKMFPHLVVYENENLDKQLQEEVACRTVNDNFMCLCKVRENVWKVKAAPNARR